MSAAEEEPVWVGQMLDGVASWGRAVSRASITASGCARDQSRVAQTPSDERTLQ